jgi:hypothetical protein
MLLPTSPSSVRAPSNSHTSCFAHYPRRRLDGAEITSLAALEMDWNPSRNRRLAERFPRANREQGRRFVEKVEIASYLNAARHVAQFWCTRGGTTGRGGSAATLGRSAGGFSAAAIATLAIAGQVHIQPRHPDQHPGGRRHALRGRRPVQSPDHVGAWAHPDVFFSRACAGGASSGSADDGYVSVSEASPRGSIATGGSRLVRAARIRQFTPRGAGGAPRALSSRRGAPRTARDRRRGSALRREDRPAAPGAERSPSGCRAR